MINDTPIRTNESYKINNIPLDFELMQEFKEFKNIKINTKNVEINEGIITPLVYGLGDEIYDNMLKYTNHNIAMKTTGKAEIEIVYSFDENNTNVLNNIQLEANHDTKIRIVYKSNTKQYNIHNGILKINAKEKVEVVGEIINLMNDVSINLEVIESNIEDNAKVELRVIDIGANKSISNIYSDAKGKKSTFEIDTVYMASKNELKDINYISHLRGEKSNVSMNIEGVLDDNSTKNFKGTLDFKSGAVKANGSEKENCTMLSDTVKSKALPILLCTEEDVEGSHSASSGKVDSDKLYYIMTRGFTKKEAIKMLVKAKFYKVLEKIESEEYIEKVHKEIDRRLV